MPRVALQLTPELLTAICQSTGVGEVPEIFEDIAYAIVEFRSLVDINLKLVTEDEIVEAAMIDSDLQIVSL